MQDITAHLIAIREAISPQDRDLGTQADLDAARAAADALLNYACACADDDLAECADQAKTWLADLAKNTDTAEQSRQNLVEMLLTLAAAYELELAPHATSAGPVVAMDDDDLSDPPDVGTPADVRAAVTPELAPGSAKPAASQAGSKHEQRDPEILAEFIVEGLEHLAEAEQHLLTLDRQPDNVEALRALFRGFHTIKGLAGFLNFPTIETLAHAAEDVLSMARDNEKALPEGAPDLILETVDRLQRSLVEIRDVPQGQPTPLEAHVELITTMRRLAGTTLVAALPPPTVSAPLATHRANAHSDDEADDAEPEGQRGSQSSARQGAVRAQRETLRVDADRLERLVDMVGELVITESMVTQAVQQAGVKVPGMGRHMTRMVKITRELHELAGSLRMVPVRATFLKMARLARDVARKSGKTVSFKVLGDDAELDKTLVDRIGDPLVHMVRNAIDHGLEVDPDARARAGKPPVGEVILRAIHRGGSVHIEVQDDGRGLDPAKIRARALERGLIRETDALDSHAITRLICEPGFSTADRVTSLSGRGVGMDVVRQQIEAMNGTLNVTSELGKGTCFSMQLPLTLAVIDGMVMRLGQERYVVPTLNVVRLVKPRDAQVHGVMGRGEVLHLGSELIPVVRPEELFEIESRSTAQRLAVVIEVDRGKVAMLVDELLGQQQVVIKSMGEGLGDVPGIAGCAIMPDGRVGLVLDVGGIIRTRQASTIALQEAS